MLMQNQNQERDLSTEQYAELQRFIKDGLRRGYGNIRLIFQDKKIVAVRDILKKEREIRIFDTETKKC